ncbi:aspartic peptidase domain-containing protein [Mycena maculata]|uniref:Aspartic peptidase domain-containing protein n=1 Tax=Mycena maculata TaxID=230809 RepID=A0AAD7HXB6_9AGAR|nr:aspartic peptidase domain-containing protein [Mycena maculata]
MDSSSKDSSQSDSTADGFGIELEIPALDTFAGFVADANAARIRYLGRRLGDTFISPPSLPAQTTVAVARSPVVKRNSNYIIPKSPLHNLVPVHGDLGPEPARDPKDAPYDQFLTTTIRTEALGSYCQVIGTLIFGDPKDAQNRKKTRDFRLEFDLGSSDLWVYGQECEARSGPQCPKGSATSPAMFWLCNPERSSIIGPEVYTARYADGSFAVYRLWHDSVYLRPQWGPPPPHEPRKAWLDLKFGVAHEVSPLFELSPTSGIVGLGRRRHRNSQPPTFLNQIRRLLETPEMTILLADDRGYITFGRRPTFGSAVDAESGTWHNNLPLVGEDYWIVSSVTKKLGEKAYNYPSGTAEIDTGSAVCYMDDAFVKDFYSSIPGATTTALGSATAIYHMIPSGSTCTPRVEIDIGGHPFTLKHFYLPGSMKHQIGNERYYVGAIQPKSILLAGSGGNYTGPDLIGRIALMNLQLVLQMPDVGPHTVSWRSKQTHFTGPARYNW